MNRKLSARTVYLVHSAALSLFFSIWVTLSMVYWVTEVGLNPLQLVLVGTATELAALLFEIPTGIVADLYSRRLSIIIGMFVIGVGIVLTGAFSLFGTVLIGQALWGLGSTFGSGATEAWIVDEVGEENAGPVFMRGTQIGLIFGLMGIPISVGLGSIDLALPLIVGGLLIIGQGVFLIVVMPETNFTPAPRGDRHPLKSMFHAFGEGAKTVRARPVLGAIIASSLVYGAYSEGFDRLWTAHILESFTLPGLGNLDTVVWFGIIDVVASILAILATEFARRRLATNNQKSIAHILSALYAGIVVSLLIFALAKPFFLALMAYWCMVVFRVTGGPIFNTWMNLNIDSRVRATVLSMSAQSNALGQIAGGPVIGYVATVWSLRRALMGSAFMLTPAIWLFSRTIRHHGDVEIGDAVIATAES